MKILLDLLQGAGTSSAVGVRPFLPALLYSVLASLDLGVDFDGTAFSFLESPVAIGVLLGAAVAVYAALRGRRADAPVQQGLLVVALVLAALYFSATLDDRFDVWWPGLILGPAFAALGALAARGLLARVSGRLDAEAAGLLPIYAEAFAVTLVVLSVLFPPLALLGLGLLAFLLRGGRRREGEKHAGLRILR